MMTKLLDAMLRAATLMVENHKFWRKCMDEFEAKRTPGQKDTPLAISFSKEQDRELEIGRHRHKKLMEGFAADPELRACMVPWMVDFTGREEPPEGMVLDAQSKAKFGELPTLVRTWCETNGFRITESGSGVGGWDLGVPCSDEDANRLCKHVHQDFRVHLDAGVLSVKLKFWGWRFKGLYNLNEAEKFIATKGVS